MITTGWRKEPSDNHCPHRGQSLAGAGIISAQKGQLFWFSAFTFVFPSRPRLLLIRIITLATIGSGLDLNIADTAGHRTGNPVEFNSECMFAIRLDDESITFTKSGVPHIKQLVMGIQETHFQAKDAPRAAAPVGNKTTQPELLRHISGFKGCAYNRQFIPMPDNIATRCRIRVIRKYP